MCSFMVSDQKNQNCLIKETSGRMNLTQTSVLSCPDSSLAVFSIFFGGLFGWNFTATMFLQTSFNIFVYLQKSRYVMCIYLHLSKHLLSCEHNALLVRGIHFHSKIELIRISLFMKIHRKLPQSVMNTRQRWTEKMSTGNIKWSIRSICVCFWESDWGVIFTPCTSLLYYC